MVHAGTLCCTEFIDWLSKPNDFFCSVTSTIFDRSALARLVSLVPLTFFICSENLLISSLFSAPATIFSTAKSNACLRLACITGSHTNCISTDSLFCALGLSVIPKPAISVCTTMAVLLLIFFVASLGIYTSALNFPSFTNLIASSRVTDLP